MTGSLTHLGGDRWKVRVYAGLDPTGRQQIRSRNFRANGQRAAERALPKIVATLQDHITEDRAHAGTIAGLAKEWMALKRRDASTSTIVSYERHVKRIIDEFGKMRTIDLTGRDIDRWYAKLEKKGKTASEILHTHSVLRAMLRQAERWGDVTTVATRACTPPVRPRTRMKIPTSSAVALLVDSTTGDLRVALELLAATGMRRGEVVGLRWSDFTDGRVTVQRAVLGLPGKPTEVRPMTKGKRDRTCDLDERTVQLVAAHLVEQRRRLGELGITSGSPWLFPDLRADPRGQRVPRRPDWLSGRWRHLCAKHGVKVRLHDLRHWHASTLIADGVPIPEVSARLGHAQVSTTLNVYAQVVPGVRGRAAGSIAGELERARGVGSDRDA